MSIFRRVLRALRFSMQLMVSCTLLTPSALADEQLEGFKGAKLGMAESAFLKIGAVDRERDRIPEEYVRESCPIPGARVSNCYHSIGEEIGGYRFNVSYAFVGGHLAAIAFALNDDDQTKQLDGCFAAFDEIARQVTARYGSFDQMPQRREAPSTSALVERSLSEGAKRSYSDREILLSADWTHARNSAVQWCDLLLLYKFNDAAVKKLSDF